MNRGFPKGWFCKRVVLTDVPWTPQNQNEGTNNGTAVPKNRNEGTKNGTTTPKNQNEGTFAKATLNYKTALLLRPKIRPEKLYAGPLFAYFPRKRSIFSSGGPEWAVLGGGQKPVLKEFMCLFLSLTLRIFSGYTLARKDYIHKILVFGIHFPKIYMSVTRNIFWN